MKIESRDNLKFFKGDSQCPFCPNIDENNVIWKGKYWYIQNNKWPYLGLENHFLVIPFRHVLKTSELTKEEFGEFPEIEKIMEEKYKGVNYFSFIRQSVSTLSRSVDHLHYHYLPGSIHGDVVENFLKKQKLGK